MHTLQVNKNIYTDSPGPFSVTNSTVKKTEQKVNSKIQNPVLLQV